MDRDAYEPLLERLAVLAQAVGTAPDLRSVFEALRRFATASTPTHGLFASLLDPETQLRHCVYAWTEDEEIDVSALPPLPMSNSPNSRSVATGQIIVTDDLQALIADQPRVDLGFDVDPRPPRSSIAVPMAVMGRVIGGFEVQSTELAAYTPEHVVAMRMAANLAAIATENVRSLERERELRQAAEAALCVRDEFLSIASHELKTPVTSMLAYVQVLQRRAARDPRSSERDQRALQVISEQAERLSRLIAALLDLSRIELGHFRIERRKVDLPGLVRRVVEQTQAMTDRHTIEYSGTHDSLIVQADDLRIEQVMQNLLQNATKYSPEGGQIDVGVEQTGDEAVVRVTDQGMGIPEGARSQLFQRFYRAANVDGSHISGLGIGLFVVKEIVSRHGGSVEVASTEGKGTTFTVRLPITLPAQRLPPR